MIDPRVIANYILDEAASAGRQLTNLDLQKIVYFMHGHYLRRYQAPLVTGQFEAWTYGPVHRVLYDAFKAYGDEPVESHATAFDPRTRRRSEMPKLSADRAIDLIKEALPAYLAMSTYSLVTLTHEHGTPWSRTVQDAEDRVNLGMKIDDALIQSYFEGHMEIA